VLGFECRALGLTPQVCYHLIHTPGPFLLYLSDRVLLFLPRTTILLHMLPTKLVLQACITMVCLFVEMGILLTYCPGCPPTMILLISASQVVGIIGMNHHAWPNNLIELCFFFFFFFFGDTGI
jgi:hypothetical protein